jgi:hypothetical protein
MLRDEVGSLVSEGDAAASFLETPVGSVASTPSLVGQRLGASIVFVPLSGLVLGVADVFHPVQVVVPHRSAVCDPARFRVAINSTRE